MVFQVLITWSIFILYSFGWRYNFSLYKEQIFAAPIIGYLFPFVICFFLIYFIYYFWLRWVFVAACGLSLVVASGVYSSLRCAGFSLRWLLLLRSTGSRRAGSVVVAHGLSCSMACGISLDHSLNLCPLHWQADS